MPSEEKLNYIYIEREGERRDFGSIFAPSPCEFIHRIESGTIVAALEGHKSITKKSKSLTKHVLWELQKSVGITHNTVKLK